MRVDIQAPESQKLKQDLILQVLINATPKQINTWVDKNISTLDDVKSILKKLIRLNACLFKNMK